MIIGGIVFGRNKKSQVMPVKDNISNDERPIKIIEVAYGIYHIVYADEPNAQ